MPMFQSEHSTISGGYFVENTGNNNPVNFNSGSAPVQTVYGTATNSGDIFVGSGSTMPAFSPNPASAPAFAPANSSNISSSGGNLNTLAVATTTTKKSAA